MPKFSKKIIYDQLCDYLKDNNLLTHCQSGFRSLHSTLTALIEATNSWSVNIDNGLVNGVIFIDLKKAFDTSDHTIFIRKLRKYGVDSSSLKWFESYLCDRNQKCSTNGHLSNTAPVSCGVPQGSNLGPLLFLVYISDLPNCLTSASPRIFADDTNITFAASTMIDLENAVNLELRNLQRWLITNRLSLNHRGPAQAASLVVCSKYKEMYGKILKSFTIVKLYRRMSKVKDEINVNLPQLLCIVVSVALNGEFE